MNDFLAHLNRLGLTEDQALLLLNDRRIISDLCIKAADIAPCDLEAANRYLSNKTRYTVQQLLKS